MKAQAEALRREGADFVVGGRARHAHRRLRGPRHRAVRSGAHAGTPTTCSSTTTAAHAMVESNYDAHYVTAIDIRIDVKVEGGKRITTWWPEFRVIDTATVTPDPEVAAVVAGYEAQLSRELDLPIGTTAVELDSRTMTVRTREAAIGTLIADAMRVSTHADAAVTNGGGIRGGRIYAPGSADHPPRHPRRAAVRQSSGRDRHQRRRSQAGDRERPVAAAQSGRPVSAGVGAGDRGRSEASGRKPRAVDESRRRPAGREAAFIVWRPTTTCCAAATATPCSATPPEVLPATDAPLISTDVMDYVARIGTVRTATGDRLVLK